MPTIAANLSANDFDVDQIALVCIDKQRDFGRSGGFRDDLMTRVIANLAFTGCTTEVCALTSVHAANDCGYNCRPEALPRGDEYVGSGALRRLREYAQAFAQRAGR